MSRIIKATHFNKRCQKLNLTLNLAPSTIGCWSGPLALFLLKSFAKSFSTTVSLSREIYKEIPAIFLWSFELHCTNYRIIYDICRLIQLFRRSKIHIKHQLQSLKFSLTTFWSALCAKNSCTFAKLLKIHAILLNLCNFA